MSTSPTESHRRTLYSGSGRLPLIATGGAVRRGRGAVAGTARTRESTDLGTDFHERTLTRPPHPFSPVQKLEPSRELPSRLVGDYRRRSPQSSSKIGRLGALHAHSQATASTIIEYLLRSSISHILGMLLRSILFQKKRNRLIVAGFGADEWPNHEIA